MEKIRSGAPSLYDQLVANNDKHHVKNLLTSFRPVEITLRFGASVPKTYVGCFCGSENGSLNRVGFFDLNQDDAFDLINGSQEDIEDALNGSPKRIRTLAINKADTFTVCEQADALHNSLCTAIQRNEALMENFVNCDSHNCGADMPKLNRLLALGITIRRELSAGFQLFLPDSSQA